MLELICKKLYTSRWLYINFNGYTQRTVVHQHSICQPIDLISHMPITSDTLLSTKMECDYLYGWIKKKQKTVTYAKLSPKKLGTPEI